LAIILSGRASGSQSDVLPGAENDGDVKYSASQLNRFIPQIMAGGIVKFDKITLELEFFSQFQAYLSFDHHPKNSGFNLTVSYRLK